MRELTFFTSNVTKLAHARYIAEGRQIKIKSFRQRTYHANYNEPRLTSRKALLDASYGSALRQCAKAGISVDSHPFLLEDTSVRIDALSTADVECPGLDVKFWMQEQTFNALDSSLRSTGNVRTALVRSDVLLHVPGALKAVWGVTDDYIVFVGEQRGTIVEREVQFDPSQVFPWLDNQSFNKWFQPCGHSVPFGALNIAEANLVDFRRKSLEQLFSFLESKNYVTNQTKQLEFSFERKPNLILCGYTCAGKTTASQHLARNFGYLHIEASDFMYLSYFYRHGYQGPVAIGDFAEQALAQKPDIVAEKIVEYVTENLSSPIIVSGFRSPEEIEFLASNLAVYGKTFQTIFVAAHESTRFQRLRARMRPGDDITLEDFRMRDNQQRRMGLELIRNRKTAKLLCNNGSIASYLDAVDGRVGPAFQDEIDVSEAISKLGSVHDVKLEDAILIALLSAWTTGETRPFFSTTEISRRINHLFKGIQPKHKDNVSRYFNQDFYAYYEISDAGRANKRTYRLSNTGYGAAVSALRQVSQALHV